MQAVASPLQTLCCQTGRTISHSQRGRVLYLYPLWGVRRRGGKKSNRTGRMLLLPSRLVGASSQMWFVWQAGVRGSQKRAGRIFREAEMISFDCFLQHFLRLQPLLWFPSDKDSIWGSITRSRTSLCPDGHWFRSACTLTRRRFWEPPLPAWWHNLDGERLRLLLLIVDGKKQETHKVARLLWLLFFYYDILSWNCFNLCIPLFATYYPIPNTLYCIG